MSKSIYSLHPSQLAPIIIINQCKLPETVSYTMIIILSGENETVIAIIKLHVIKDDLLTNKAKANIIIATNLPSGA